MRFTARDVTQRLFLHRGRNVEANQNEIQAFIPLMNLTKNSSYDLSMNFVGTIGLSGGPRQLQYTTPQNETRTSITFCSEKGATNGLRSLIPCLDGADYPAEFNILIQYNQPFTAFSNFRRTYQQTSNLNSSLSSSYFNSTFALNPADIAFALVELKPQTTVVNGNITISLYYRQKILQSISIDRVLQFMNDKSFNIGKLDVLSLPELDTAQVPGVSFLNEDSVRQENIDLGVTSP
ncbi:unnamed protein product [Caenorhabditis auriculariae]|uniref:Aminopeptidase N-like N-terminal domain-containing protein n=1 Tax=Caenorhabditis auriculariae TaxID=2777116 RepID=A0A8S1GW35_9PELO|nr:unnamed protein product [Caenorhabditis auriculariae]